jgi:uncharacterized membrane protein YidH (DUF202 family)
MGSAKEKSMGPPGVAALFDEKERKDLFRKYLYLLGWVELGILLTCWLYQIVDAGRVGDGAFPWRLYFVVAFLAPVGVTFLLGVAVVGFNRYFAEPEKAMPGRRESKTAEIVGAGRIQQLDRMLTWFRKVPFLGLLLLLAFGVGFFYKLDVILATIGSIGEKTAKILLTSIGVVLLLASILGLILIILNYRLRKSQMEYQYKGQVAERLGLVILDDNTVLNSSGKLLVDGRRLKPPIQLLPELPGESKPSENPGSVGPASRLPDTEK